MNTINGKYALKTKTNCGLFVLLYSHMHVMNADVYSISILSNSLKKRLRRICCGEIVVLIQQSQCDQRLIMNSDLTLT